VRKEWKHWLAKVEDSVRSETCLVAYLDWSQLRVPEVAEPLHESYNERAADATQPQILRGPFSLDTWNRARRYPP
jgi:hypothetical protein